MKFFSALALIIVVAGCTTMQPIDGTPTELQHFINSGVVPIASAQMSKRA